MSQAIEPTVEQARTGACDPHEVLKHPAFATVILSHTQGSRSSTLFGSDVGSMGCVRIEVRHAELHRNLSRDWIHPSGQPVVIFELTHTQFAEFITSAGRGEGTPVTLVRAPETPAVPVPQIAKIRTKQDTLKREIHDAVAGHLEHLRLEAKRLEELIESGRLPKKELREIAQNLSRHIEQAPDSLAFVIESAEETLEAATTNARMEVDAYINTSRARELGLEHLSQLTGRAADKPLPAPQQPTD